MQNDDFIVFYDWESCKVIRRIDIESKKLYWNELGTFLCVTSTNEFYILAYNKEVVAQ